PFHFKVGKQVTMRLGENHSQVVRVRLRPRLGQCPKIGLPGFVFLAQALELAFDEERGTLAEVQAISLIGHGHFLFCAFVLFATNSDSSPPWKKIIPCNSTKKGCRDLYQIGEGSRRKHRGDKGSWQSWHLFSTDSILYSPPPYTRPSRMNAAVSISGNAS